MFLTDKLTFTLKTIKKPNIMSTMAYKAKKTEEGRGTIRTFSRVKIRERGEGVIGTCDKHANEKRSKNYLEKGKRE